MEMRMSGRKRGAYAALRRYGLADEPLKIVVPPRQIRRRKPRDLFPDNGVEIAAMLKWNARIGTLEFVDDDPTGIHVLTSVISVKRSRQRRPRGQSISIRSCMTS